MDLQGVKPVRLSARGEYGVRAMAHLALNYNEGPVPLSKVASSENISHHFLEQIFVLLRRGGLIKSVRGVKGGYMLALPPREVCVGDIIRVLEGPIAPVECVSENGGNGGSCRCERTDDCLARHVWEKLRDHINEMLDKTTLQDMMDWKQ